MKNGSRFSGEELIFFSSDKKKRERERKNSIIHTLTVFSQVIILSLNLANCSGQL